MRFSYAKIQNLMFSDNAQYTQKSISIKTTNFILVKALIFQKTCRKSGLLYLLKNTNIQN